MWLSRKMSGEIENGGASVGPVTIGGGSVGVMAGAERRGARVFAPGGYVWRPPAGDDLLVIKCRDGTICAAAAETENGPGGMLDGEVYIKSKGGAAVWLKNNGTVVLTGSLAVSGRVDIEGSLYVNGTQIA